MDDAIDRATSRILSDSEEQAREYDEVARTIFSPIYPVIAGQILKNTGIAHGTCLDVGSGPAHLAIALAALSDLKVYAMDRSPSMCRIGQTNVEHHRQERRVKPVLGDVHSIPFDDDSMDLVVSRGSVFFWSDRTRAFSECRRVLRPGGKAYIGGGFGSADLRNDICPRMLERDPDWDEKRRGWVGRCDIDSIHEGLLGARIVEFDVARDDSGFWIRFTQEE